MRRELLEKQWYLEEEAAHIKGWDFSHIHGRYEEEEDLPWDYEGVIQSYRKDEMKILDLDTGGGEFLLSLGHPYKNLSATEAYPPNVELCKYKLLPLGIDFKEAVATKYLPYPNETFDMVINRHGGFNEKEIYRVLKPNGLFITQQVGAENDRGLVELLYSSLPDLPAPDNYLSITEQKFIDTGFMIMKGQEAFRPIKFYDVGALVWFARIIEWEFPDFSVDKHLKELWKAQEILENKGRIEASIHRYMMVARKD